MPRIAAVFRRWTFLLVGAVAWLCRSLAAEQMPLVTSYGTSELGTDTETWTARQDTNGTLYFGGNTVITFDGERWRRHAVPDAYGVYGLSLGNDGKLWVGAYGNLGWFEPGPSADWTFHSLLPQVSARLQPLGQIFYVFAENQGAVFITADRILRWNGTEFRTWSLPNTRRLPTMRGADGVIYIYFQPRGLLALRANGPEVVIPRSLLGEAAVLWLDQREDDWLLATHRGLFRFRPGTVEPVAPEVSAILARDALTSGVRLPDGRYAFGTMLGGIIVMSRDGRLEATLREPEGLPTHTINSLFVDREGSLWATSGSVFRVEIASPTTVFDARMGLPTHAYDSIARSHGRLFAGSENGVYALDSEDRVFGPVEHLSEQVHAIHDAPFGLVVTGRRTAKLFAGDSAEPFYTTERDVFSCDVVRSSDRLVYLADDSNVVLAGPGQPPRTVVHKLPDIARSIVEDDAGDLWLGTLTRGVLRARPNPLAAVEAISVSGTMGLPELTGRAIARATVDGSILIFAERGGWFKARGQSMFTSIRDYPAREIRAASEISTDEVCWLLHGARDDALPVVARIRIDGDHAEWQPHTVPALARIGMPRSIFAETDPNGATVLWIGGTKSVLRHVVAHGPSAPQPRPPLLQAYAHDTRSSALTPIAKALPFSTPSLTFEFAVPEFSRRDALRLESRIDGIDPNWVRAGPESRRDLTALRDGKFAIRVRVIADTGVASEPTVFRFEVLPPFWRTTPFYLLVGLTLVPVVYGGYLLRIRTLRRRNAQLETKVRERTEELVAANAAKTQFVANMSHDIRNPLNGIVGLALALEDSRLDRRQREIVATLRECTTYLSSLVDDVLDFASIEAGRVELRPGPFVAAELLRSIVETMKSDSAASGAQLQVVVAADVPAHLQGDAGRIQQILVNFVSNALKYAGGNIRLAVVLPPDSPGEVEFSVADQGPGISEAERATLFAKFSRLRQKRGGEEIPGTGLGLASCRLLADLMGGSVGVESQPGDGARFFLRLPLTIATAPETPDTSHLPNTTVLVVEDANYNAWAASAVLARLGLTSERARTGAEALALFDAKRHNLVLLDRNLPDLDGIEVARRIRELETAGRQSVLLAVTAYCTPEDRDRCLQAGMDGFVGKPLTPDKLRKALLAAGRQMLAPPSLDGPEEVPLPGLDLQLLNYLADGTPEGLARQVERYLASLQAGQLELERTAGAGDFEPLSRGAHQLYGQAKMVSATALVQAAYDLELAARESDGEQCRRHLQRVTEETRRVTAAMRRRLRAAHSA